MFLITLGIFGVGGLIGLDLALAAELITRLITIKRLNKK